MALNFEIYNRTERNELGTIAEVVGAGGKMKLVPSNFQNPDKRVVVVLERQDGTSSSVICSANVSAQLRSKEITLGQLQGFTIVEQVLPDGEIINIITMPSGGGLVEFSINNNVEAYQAPAFDPSELVAF